MNYYGLTREQQEEQRKHINADDDFCRALECHPQPFNLHEVDRVLAVVQGDRAGSDWYWLVELLEPERYVYMTGRCDYTGWE